MSFNIDALLQLGELDRKLIEVRQRLVRAPRLAAPQRQRVATVTSALEQLATKTKPGQRETTRVEGEAEAEAGPRSGAARRKRPNPNRLPRRHGAAGHFSDCRALGTGLDFAELAKKMGLRLAHGAAETMKWP